MSKSRKYPMSLEQYAKKHRTAYGDIFVEARYIKAKFVYDDIKFNKSTRWKDKDFGKLTKPEDAFEIWWDV